MDDSSAVFIPRHLTAKRTWTATTARAQINPITIIICQSMGVSIVRIVLLLARRSIHCPVVTMPTSRNDNFYYRPPLERGRQILLSKVKRVSAI